MTMADPVEEPAGEEKKRVNVFEDSSRWSVSSDDSSSFFLSRCLFHEVCLDPPFF